MGYWNNLNRRFLHISFFFITLFLTFVCSLHFAFDVYASDNEIRDIAISVQMEDDGSAQITEVWDVYVGGGTEWYLVQGNSSSRGAFSLLIKLWIALIEVLAVAAAVFAVMGHGEGKGRHPIDI